MSSSEVRCACGLRVRVSHACKASRGHPHPTGRKLRDTPLYRPFLAHLRRTEIVVDHPQSALSRRGVLISRQVAEHPRGSVKRAILLLFCVRPIYATSRRHLVCGPYTSSNDRNKSRHLQRERLYRVLSIAVAPARIDVGGSQQILACRTWLS